LGVALVATVLAGLVTALVLSFVLEDETPAGEPVLLTLAADGTVPQTDLAGETVPDFAYIRLDAPDGAEVDFETFRDGRPAVVNFFYKDCPPCVAEMPALQEAYETYGDRVAFLGLSYRESVEDGRELVERTGVTYEIGRDPAGDIITEFAAVGLPTTVFVTADGEITVAHTGDVRAELDAALEALVAA
jgi:thiol-disulfide isomerase/thioredoxin